MKAANPHSMLVLAIAFVLSLGGCATKPAVPGAAAGSSSGSTASSDAGPPNAKPAEDGASPAEDQQVAAIVADNKAVITFPLGGATLTAEANRKLDLAARLFRDASPVVMFAAGYTDRTGAEYNNLLLAARRAEVIKNGLVARGIPENRLLVQAFGESVLANPADPAGAENRRVVITWNLH